MESQAVEDSDANTNSGATYTQKLSSIWPLSCQLSSLLSINCRARAQELATSVHAKFRNPSSIEDMIPLTCTGSMREHIRTGSIDERSLGKFYQQKPLRIVTSEPTMKRAFEMHQNFRDDDIDHHYDFGSSSPDDGRGASIDDLDETDNSSQFHAPFQSKVLKSWPDNHIECGERPESGCATSVTSPINQYLDRISPCASPTSDSSSAIANTNMKTEHKMLSFSSFSDVENMCKSDEFSVVDSGLYTEADLNLDSVDFFQKHEYSDDEDETWQTCNDFSALIERPSNLENLNRNYNISPPEGFRNMEITKSIENKPRRRSFDLHIKSYMNPEFRRSSPPGFRINSLFSWDSNSKSSIKIDFKNSSKKFTDNCVNKCESEVVCSATAASKTTVETKLCKTSRQTSNATNINTQESPEACIISLRHSSNHEAWHKRWHHVDTKLEGRDDEVEGEGVKAISANNLLGTESWHTTPRLPQQLITESVCEQQAGCNKPVPSTGGAVQCVKTIVEKKLTNRKTSGESLLETEASDRIKMHDENEGVSRPLPKRRLNVNEGQTTLVDENSAGASVKHVVENIGETCDSVHDDECNNQAFQSKDKSVEKNVQKYSQNASECSSPVLIQNNPVNENSDISNKISPLENWNEGNLKQTAIDEKLIIGENKDNDNDNADDNEDIPEVTEKFKKVKQYKERVRRSSKDDSIESNDTNVIQIDESLLSEPVEDVSSHGQVNLENIDNRLSTAGNSYLDVEDPSRESSSEPDDDTRQRIVRSSSLKCGKTPPGTPGTGATKKMVRFTDTLGLDLVDVRLIYEGVPDVPLSAYYHLNLSENYANRPGNQSDSDTSFRTNANSIYLRKKMIMQLFPQPLHSQDFMESVRRQKVKLEEISITESLHIKGYIRVLNVDFRKKVTVRYTIDGWKKFYDVS